MANRTDKFSKTQVLGLRADGAPPRDGKVKLPPSHRNLDKMPISHTSNRDYEAVAEGDGVLGRSGGKPKNSEVRVHDGMHSRTKAGNLVVGITSTTAAALDDEKLSMQPVVSKGLKTAAPSWGQRSRTQAGEVTPLSPGQAHARSAVASDALHAQRHATGAAIMENSLAVSGSDHPVRMSRKADRFMPVVPRKGGR